MTFNFLSKNHPWMILKEDLSFPSDDKLAVMKSTMDGNSISTIAKELSITNKEAKDLLKIGMENANVKNMYELVLWGLRTGIIQDDPVNIDIANDIKQYSYETYPTWLKILNFTVSGYSDIDIQREANISKDSLEHQKSIIKQKYNLGNSTAQFIRFAFKALNPIKPPNSFRGFKPFKAWKSPYSTLTNPPMISKFKPADIDPNIPVYDKATKHNLKDTPDFKKVYIPKPSTSTEKPKPPVSRTSTIQTALSLLGIDEKEIYGQKKDNSFWDRPSEYLWTMLELAKRRYDLEIIHAHPDQGGYPKRAVQLNAAWRLAKKLFSKHGYTINEGINIPN